MKLEVGKTYICFNEKKIKCVGLVPENQYWPYVCVNYDTASGLMQPFLVDINGDSNSHLFSSRVKKEYKEPVTHKQDVVWFKLPDQKNVLIRVVGVGEKIYSSFSLHDVTELKRQTITYTEEG